MTNEAYNWTTFTKQLYIKADLPQVFRAWTTPEGIVQWFIAQATYTADDGTARRAADVIQPGDQYHWCWHQALEMRGVILDVVENERLRFTFGDKRAGSDEKIIVTVTFSPHRDETLIELTQDNMGDTLADHAGWHLSCNLGWSFFLTNLKAWLEHGVDLREKDVERAYATRAVTH